ncbi:uncharacterized protein [Rutidosis leptorrhynchoides]|uniref:uncharacterized protein isoform X1 n=1 Tax=Rutidosis leptorrhynchoides TaxID=125765 RepID=UPI003A9A655E
MELQGAPGKPWIPKLTLEDYLNLEHLDVIDPVILRKIIMMHGFNSNKIKKGDLLDVVRSINLMDVHRSTLLSDVSSNAFLGLNDVIRDLSLLHWQECCTSSIKTFNSVTSFCSGVVKFSPKSSKQNCNIASNSQEESEDHETQSRALKKKQPNNVIQTNSEAQPMDLQQPNIPTVWNVYKRRTKRHVEGDVEESTLVTYNGEQVDQMNRPKAHFGKQVDLVKRPKVRYRELMDVVNLPKSHYGEQVDQVNFPKAHYEEQVDPFDRPKVHYREQADQVKRPNAYDGKQVDPVKKCKRGINKPIWLKGYIH